MIALGKALRSVRTARMLTITQVASAAKMSRAALANIEAGRRDVGMLSFLEICKVLNVSPAVVMVIADPETKDLLPYAAAMLAKGM